MNSIKLREFSKELHQIIFSDFKGLNLTSFEDFDDFYTKQIEDSLIPWESEQGARFLEGVTKIVDVGFGGGFPLLPLAKVFPQKEFIGLEARSKKVKAVSRIIQDLSLPNVKVFHYRLEQVLLDEPVLLTSKAVGTVGRMVEQVNLSHSIIKFAIYKGPNFSLEKELEKTSKESLTQQNLIDYSLTGGDLRKLFLFSLNVPRGTIGKGLKYLKNAGEDKAQRLVKLSQLN